jgi:hypothetical protein
MYRTAPAPEAPSQTLEPRILTIVRLGLDSADAQVLAEERHGWVLGLRTLASHGTTRKKLGTK